MTQNSKRESPYIQSCACDLVVTEGLLGYPLGYLLIHDEIIPAPNPERERKFREELAQIASQFKGDVLPLSANSKPKAWDDPPKGCRMNKRRFVIAMESDEYTDPASVCDWKYLSTILEGCEAAVLALEVGEFTQAVPMYMVVRLKDAE